MPPKKEKRTTTASGMLLPRGTLGALALLQDPKHAHHRSTIVASLAREGRAGDLERAVMEGVLDPNIQVDARERLIHVAASVPFGLSLLRYLVVDRGMDPDEPQATDCTPLILAIINDMEEAALWLIDEAPRVNVNWAGADGGTALMCAAQYGRISIVKALLSKGADVHATLESDGKQMTTVLVAGRRARRQAEAVDFMRVLRDLRDGPPVAGCAAAAAGPGVRAFEHVWLHAAGGAGRHS